MEQGGNEQARRYRQACLARAKAQPPVDPVRDLEYERLLTQRRALDLDWEVKVRDIHAQNLRARWANETARMRIAATVCVSIISAIIFAAGIAFTKIFLSGV